MTQLQVVDDDQSELATLAMQTTRARAQVDRIERRRLVDIDRRLVHLAQRKGQPRPLVVIEATSTDAMGIEPADR